MSGDRTRECFEFTNWHCNIGSPLLEIILSPAFFPSWFAGIGPSFAESDLPHRIVYEIYNQCCRRANETCMERKRNDGTYTARTRNDHGAHTNRTRNVYGTYIICKGSVCRTSMKRIPIAWAAYGVRISNVLRSAGEPCNKCA